MGNFDRHKRRRSSVHGNPLIKPENQQSFSKKSDSDQQDQRKNISDSTTKQTNEKPDLLMNEWQNSKRRNSRPSIHIPMQNTSRRLSNVSYNISRRSQYVQPQSDRHHLNQMIPE